MDALLSPKFRTRTQKFYYQNNPDNETSQPDGGPAASSPGRTSASPADSAVGISPKKTPAGGKASYFTFDHVPADK
jgi:hypothetical protein